MQAVCVFCGSGIGTQKQYIEAARATGRAIAMKGYRLVYGGARVGLMGAVADAALAAGGEVFGVMPRSLADKELAHEGLSQLYLVNSMHERKAMMIDLADGFITLPGGTGTFEEMFEVWTWAQLGYHKKPVGVLNTLGYYDKLLEFFNHTVAEGFVKPAMNDILKVAETPEEILQRFENYVPPKSKWDI